VVIPMDDLVIELILIAMIVMPAIAASLQPAKVASRTSSGALGKLRRGN